jgi:hypothetical protein
LNALRASGQKRSRSARGRATTSSDEPDWARNLTSCGASAPTPWASSRPRLRRRALLAVNRRQHYGLPHPICAASTDGIPRFWGHRDECDQLAPRQRAQLFDARFLSRRRLSGSRRGMHRVMQHTDDDVGIGKCFRSVDDRLGTVGGRDRWGAVRAVQRVRDRGTFNPHPSQPSRADYTDGNQAWLGASR